MNVDRYTRIVLTVIAAALVVLTVRPWLPSAGLVDVVRLDQAQAQTLVPKYEVAIPRSWGKLVAYSNNNLLLEAPDQTLRVVDIEGKAPEYPKLKALIHWQ